MNCPKCDFETDLQVVMFTHKRQFHPELFEEDESTSVMGIIGIPDISSSPYIESEEVSEDPELEVDNDFN